MITIKAKLLLSRLKKKREGKGMGEQPTHSQVSIKALC